MIEKKMSPVRVSEDVYWYLARYKATKRVRTYSEVVSIWFEIVNRLSVERQHELIFDVAARKGLKQDKIITLDSELVWKLKAYAAQCKFKYIDYALMNLIGIVMAIEGSW